MRRKQTMRMASAVPAIRPEWDDESGSSALVLSVCETVTVLVGVDRFEVEVALRGARVPELVTLDIIPEFESFFCCKLLIDDNEGEG